MAYDRIFQKEIVRAIREELNRSNEMADEVWLTEKQLIEEMPFFKKKWIKEKGHKLHPRFAWVTDKKGKYHCSKKYYPKNAILKQLREEKIADDELMWATYQYRLKGGELEIAGYEFNHDWKKGLSIDEIVYHL